MCVHMNGWLGVKVILSLAKYKNLEYICHERQLQGLERKAKVEGSQLRLYKAKEGSRKHEALHA